MDFLWCLICFLVVTVSECKQGLKYSNTLDNEIQTDKIGRIRISNVYVVPATYRNDDDGDYLRRKRDVTNTTTLTGGNTFQGFDNTSDKTIDKTNIFTPNFTSATTTVSFAPGVRGEDGENSTRNNQFINKTILETTLSSEDSNVTTATDDNNSNGVNEDDDEDDEDDNDADNDDDKVVSDGNDEEKISTCPNDSSLFGKYGVPVFVISIVIAIILLCVLIWIIARIPRIKAKRKCQKNFQLPHHRPQSPGGVSKPPVPLFADIGDAPGNKDFIDLDRSLSSVSESDDDRDDGFRKPSASVSTFLLRKESQRKAEEEMRDVKMEKTAKVELESSDKMDHQLSAYARYT